jgi:hypothetical protein
MIVQKVPTEYVYVPWNKTISKFLWHLGMWYDWEILNYIRSFAGHDTQIEEIFLRYWKYIEHFALDEKDMRYKFYINLYHLSSIESLKILKDVKDILGETRKYFLEKNFLQFDCIWIDIYPDKTKKIKIYEIVKNWEPIPSILQNISINEVGYLKDFSWRKKMFFRLNPPYPHLSVFVWSIDEWVCISVEEKFKISFQRKVKYYCIEWKNIELYCI